MMRAAAHVAAWSAVATFIVLLALPVRRAECAPIPGHQGATACNYRRPAAAASALSEDFRAIVLTAAAPAPVLAASAPTARPTAMAEPLPAWMPPGVLRWEAEIHEAANRAGLDPLMLAILVSIECPSGNPQCGSHMGAHGLAQFMPGTASAVEMRSGLPCSDRMDPVTSLRCGAYHFVELLNMCGAIWGPGDEANAIACAGAAYNAGPGYAPVVVAHVQGGGDPRNAPIPAETRRWVTLAMDAWAKAGRR